MSIDIGNSDIALFQSQDRLELLNDIDKFRQDGLANLPQIVVCGDTSSGKSSVLEALSGIPFPVDSTICTRFATEIALRYSLAESVTGEASISPAPGASASHRERLASFPKAVASLEAVPEIIQNAKEFMRLGEATGISRDVLHLKLYGQSLPNLTLIDLPGLIHAATDTDDIAKVQNLVEHYFKQEESLILTIVSAENPVENQGILTLSQRFDPTGARSIGVITKPDVLRRPDKARLTNSILELAKNQHNGFKFKRGWQIIRCLTDDERQQRADRVRIETDLFQQSPWNTFDRKRLGTESLRSVLCEYLQEHIIRVLPELSKSLDQRVASVKSSLQDLGPHRASNNERMQYLIRLSRRYGQIVNDALSGNYSDSFFHGHDPTTRLRATTMALADDFEQAMRSRGHTYEFTNFAFSVADPNGPQRIGSSEALTKVAALMESFRGPELPLLFNPHLVGELFKEQSQKWPAIASDYTHRICRAIRVFLRMVIESMCPSTGRTTELILRHVFDDALHSHEERLNQKLLELFEPYTGSFLFSTKRRLQASMDQLDLYFFVDGKDDARDTRIKLVRYSMAYYKVVFENFIDNVVVLGVESCMLSKLEEMFSPETVAKMTEEMVRLLGGESPDITAERKELTAQLGTLEQALKNCRRHASREFGFGRESVPEPNHQSGSQHVLTDAVGRVQSKSPSLVPNGTAQSAVHGNAEEVVSSFEQRQEQSSSPTATQKPVHMQPGMLNYVKVKQDPPAPVGKDAIEENSELSKQSVLTNKNALGTISAPLFSFENPFLQPSQQPQSLLGTLPKTTNAPNSDSNKTSGPKTSPSVSSLFGPRPFGSPTSTGSPNALATKLPCRRDFSWDHQQVQGL